MSADAHLFFFLSFFSLSLLGGVDERRSLHEEPRVDVVGIIFASAMRRLQRRLGANVGAAD